jgi:hypothetical protein
MADAPPAIGFRLAGAPPKPQQPTDGYSPYQPQQGYQFQPPYQQQSDYQPQPPYQHPQMPYQQQQQPYQPYNYPPPPPPESNPNTTVIVRGKCSHSLEFSCTASLSFRLPSAAGATAAARPGVGAHIWPERKLQELRVPSQEEAPSSYHARRARHATRRSRDAVCAFARRSALRLRTHDASALLLLKLINRSSSTLRTLFLSLRGCS